MCLNPRVGASLTLLMSLCFGGVASALAPPVFEGFDAGPNNWRDAGLSELTLVPNGGPDGSSYVTAEVNLLGASVGAPKVMIRAQTVSNPITGEVRVASDGQFFGDWFSQVGEFRAMVRHNAPEPVSFFVRFAQDPLNHPGITANIPVPVAGNVWTELVVPIDLSGPNWQLEGPGSLGTFSDVDRIQIGFYPPASLVGVDQQYSLDLDGVRLLPVPEPATWALFGLVGFGWLAVRRSLHAQ